ncbi:helix-turn-helix domain-containing protein [Amycolatopsis echigonensis]|uniref:Helix-turn-helix transcriptional regulator n=1 Tax=Amycolatopsis echigonensis TaxID=2576905 RepID=A0A8E2BA60_9PSEU|nr:helix-turn-helix transcriptional regulator [Amycolatopsis echigonensis]MBB2505995.1 helix-turn-helix transcriptional regulator [Amycolatopsis echigonensis]
MPILRNVRAQRLALTRKRGRKITAREIAGQIGMTPSHYYNVESGNQPGSEEMAHLLADVFECDVDELLPEAKGKPSKPPVQPKPTTTGPPKRERTDTKSPGRVHPEAGAA